MGKQLGWNTNKDGTIQYYVDQTNYLTGLTSLPVNPNLFSNKNSTPGYLFYDGRVVKQSTDFSSEFIMIDTKYSQITISSFDDNIQTGRIALCFYDSNQAFISRPLVGGSYTPFVNNYRNIYWQTVDIPTNAAFFRVSFGGDTIKQNSIKKVEFGNAITNWVAANGDDDTVIDNDYAKMMYYFDNSGFLQKSGNAIINGDKYYFDSKNGIVINGSKPQYDIGLTVISDEYTPHNKLYSTNAVDIENVDGFLTADSWYRPVDILDNGTTWRPSNKGEMRPALMVWMPDKQTLVNYLNYMTSISMIGYSKTFTLKDNIKELLTNQRQVQIAIEKNITQAGNADFLRDVFSKFVATQDNWNKKSEFNDGDHLQGGALRFVNDDNLPKTNSSHRLFNRYPLNQKGGQNKDSGWQGGYELLLANDIDNSNPVVQAEQLNWLYFLTHIGSINSNDDTANFDGIRVDAVDNVDADLLQIAGDYYNETYGLNKDPNKANQRISILEDWAWGDYDYMGHTGQTQLTMDSGVKDGLMGALGFYNESLKPLDTVISSFHANRREAFGNNKAVANYSFIRAHDAESQDIIAKCITDTVKGADGWHPTWEQVEQGFKAYIADMESTLKLRTRNNIPAMYGILLTNKDTVPRVYYGDLFYESGQYMANKTIYAPVIEKIMQYRKATVAGGQWMDKINRTLISVRLGKYLDKKTDDVTKLTPEQFKVARNSGSVIIISNEKDYNLLDQKTVIDLGMAHATQKFKAIVNTLGGTIDLTSEIVKTTNDKGQLIFDNTEIVGSTSPQHWGYFSMWVPVEVDLSYDIREFVDKNQYNDGKVFHSGEVLDSHVIYESFSNFTTPPTKPEERANIVIQSKVDYFKSLGITVFEFAPQYRSSTDTSFLDACLQNGYAFSDRYDLGYDNNPTKYGTIEDLQNAIKALHSAGIQAMADYVPDQIYNLSLPEIVVTNRVNSYGDLRDTTRFQSLYYVAKTKSNGTDYQSRFGGKFLNIMLMTTPKIFDRLQISTGEKIYPYEQISQWSAKYMNGTNTLGKGAYYVLKDWSSDEYFNINGVNTELPAQLRGDYAQYGFVSSPNGDIQYYSMSGAMAKDTFIQDEKGNWYYFDADGNMAHQKRTIMGYDYYFTENGIELINSSFADTNGDIIYTNTTGKGIAVYQVIFKNGLYVQANNQTVLANGYQMLQDSKKYLWFDNGRLFSGFKIVDGKYYFLYQGEKLTSSFQNVAGVTFYVDQDGNTISGLKYTNNQLMDFGRDNSFWLKKTIKEQKPNFMN